MPSFSDAHVFMEEFARGSWPQSWLLLFLAAPAVLLLKQWLTPSALSKIPLVGLEIGNEEARRLAYLAGAKSIYQAGYEQFKDGVFRITTARPVPTVVVHPRFLAELNKLPDRVLSMNAAVYEAMEAQYTRLSTVPTVPHAIKTQLNPGLVRLNAAISEEVELACERELPACDEWRPVQIQPKLLQIVAAASGRIFVGPEICREKKYLDVSINFTNDVMTAQSAIAQTKQWFRPLLAPRLPEVQQLNRRRADAKKYLAPLIQRRRQLLQVDDPGQARPDDMLQWFVEAQARSGSKDDGEITEQQLGISFAAIHTTTLTATNAFYNLAAMPEVAAELRREVLAVLEANGGQLTCKALQDMKKLDSFMKETMRCYPFVFATYQRKAVKSFTLSNGQVIPAGVTIECPAHAIHNDDSVFENAQEFDALRFYKLREKSAAMDESEMAAQNQFVSVSKDSLPFGYGRHACPGRFFAGNEIKLILAVSLRKYEMRLAEGSTVRYPNMEFAQLSIPDPTKTILLRQIAA